MRIEESLECELSELLAGPGLQLSLGPYRFSVRSRIPKIREAIRILYGQHELAPAYRNVHFDVRYDACFYQWHRSIAACVNGQIWHTWPTRLTVAAMEWIHSWCFFRGSIDKLGFHAAVAVRPGDDENAVVFPGCSGAGKSTLASTLMMQGWSLLSDEIALFDLNSRKVCGLGRPTILKGESISLMVDRFGPRAQFGPSGFMENPRTEVAHLRPTAKSVGVNGKEFIPRSFVFPNRVANVSPRLEPLDPGTAFSRLIQTGINFREIGKPAFDAAIDLAKQASFYDLHYSDSSDAEQFLLSAKLWSSPGTTVPSGFDARDKFASVEEVSESTSAANANS